MTGRNRNGPDFICIGLRKAATRWLYSQLREHPDFALPPVKELHFFDRRFPPKDLARRIAKSTSDNDARFFDLLGAMNRSKSHDMETYSALFDVCGDKITGDITPAYGSNLGEEKIAELARVFPDTKILMMLRDPISRAWSNLNDIVNTGKLAQESARLAGAARESVEHADHEGRFLPFADL